MKDDAAQGAAFVAVAQPSRRGPIGIVVASVVVLAVALVAKQTAPAPPVSTAPSAHPASADPRTLVVAATPTAEQTIVPPTLNSAVTPHPIARPGPVEAGVSDLIPDGSTHLRLEVTLPDGWQKAGAGVYVRSADGDPVGLSISAWTLQRVYVYPCRWASQAFADPQLMRTAEGQAVALSSWWGQDPNLLPYWNSKIAPIARAPRATTFLGYPAWYVEVLIPTGLDPAQCDGGELILWNAAGGGVKSSGPGELDRLWVVDVNGDATVIDAAALSVISAADAKELQAVIDSITIAP